MSTEFPFHPVEEALDDLKAGRMIVVVDDEQRENEGDLICAAQFATPLVINFMAVYGRGLICLALPGSRLDELDIPLMVGQNTDPNQTAFTVSIDAAPHLGVSTGISASDRSRTIQAVIHPQTRPQDLRRPGHIFPLRAKDGGVLKRAGHTEAAVDLARLAGLYPAGVICEIQNDDGSMARLPELMDYSRQHDLKVITIASLIEYRLRHERFVVRESVAKLPSQFGEFMVYGYRDTLNQGEHVAIVKGDPATFGQQDVLVRVHSECLTGDALGSLRCDCRPQLEAALKMIEHQGQGVVIYLRQEGRGIGLVNKLKAYSLQDLGLDTVEANERLGFAADLRHYGVGAQMLSDLGVHNIQLITNNPRKIVGLKGFGIEVVGRVPLIVEANFHNARYLQTKAEKLGHLLPQTHLLILGLFGESPWSDLQRSVWLDKIAHRASEVGLLAMEDSRPLALTLMGEGGLVVQVGYEQPCPESPWYAEDSDCRAVIFGLLQEVQHWEGIIHLSWMVSPGRDPLAWIPQQLNEHICEDIPAQWAGHTIYHWSRPTHKGTQESAPAQDGTSLSQ
ncbi:MAG: bifunctional 3,4-dihydroxy-2-butanone-4-phosphate synthase/GTP cyclohydrolase II [Synechococcales cyanobacterium]